jgi:valyl-tRNA synthetase
MRGYQFGEAQRQIHDFLWGEFCDWYIEFAKIRLNSTTKEGLSPIPVLVYVLETSLRLLHPYMPFVTEELWQNLSIRLPSHGKVAESIMIAAYPDTETPVIDFQAELVIESIIEIIRSIRNTRAQYKVESTRWVESRIYAGELASAITNYSQTIQTLARTSPVTFPDGRWEGLPSENTVVSVLKDTEVVIPMKSMVNVEVERKRLQDEIEQSQAGVARLEVRLNDQAFLNKAPATVIDKERQKLHTLTDKLERLKQKNLNF